MIKHLQHIPVSAQGPLIANALSMTMQFKMSIWHMISDKCIRPLHAKHSDWCEMASIVQAIVETFPNNCAIMFPARSPQHWHWCQGFPAQHTSSSPQMTMTMIMTISQPTGMSVYITRSMRVPLHPVGMGLGTVA